ncbi:MULTISPECIES: zinc-finger-containing protein [Variovorax]|uniref:zinc-finger-containing protein n=1 Tax=Variovorax TaxID=34072 RepID=UPI0028614A2B|nr:zinc-finger-containing protein [Variovorax sp. 3319]MDR6887834.1 hypothetical protein [Variovorax sp. 3319]
MTAPHEPITPWNPSRRATARVKNPLPVPDCCPTCGSKVWIGSNATIYGGREYGEWPWALMCTGCDSYVGLHPFTGIPLGTLATPEIRAARKEAKAAFNPLWEGDGAQMTRTAAYGWLAAALGIENVAECHIGWFGVDQCRAVLAAIKARGAAPAHRHTCHWPGCSRAVPPAMWGCSPHWFTLPKALRDDIWRTYRPGQEITKTPSEAYVAAARAVQQWIAHHQKEKAA